jgi:DNA polymerase III delta prime subunit
MPTPHRVNITEDGRQALLKLSKGDMRRVLNVLQVRQPHPGIFEQ